MNLDQAQPGPDILDVGVVDLHLPVIADAAQVRILEPQIDDRVDEKIDQVDFIGAIDALAHVHDAVQGDGGKLAGAVFQDGKGFLEQLSKIPVLFPGKEPFQGSIDVTQGLFMNQRQPRYVHDVEQKKDLPLIALAGGFTRVEQLLGNCPVIFDDLVVARQAQKLLEQVGMAGRLLVDDRFHPVSVPPDGPMGDL